MYTKYCHTIIKGWLASIALVFFSLSIFAQVTQTYSYTMGASNPITGATQLKELDNAINATSILTKWTQVGGITASLAANKWSSNISLPFTFKYYGETVTACKVTANGILTFNTATTIVPSGDNASLPSSALPTKTICFWDRFTTKAPTAANDLVYTRTVGISPNRQFWIKWNSFEIGGNTTSAVSDASFAVVFEESTNCIYLVDMFKGTPSTLSLSMTIGLQYNSYYYKQVTTASALASSTTAYANNLYYKFTPTSITEDSLSYTNSDLSSCSSGGTTRTLAVTSASGCLSTSLKSSKLYASLNLGEDYEYGSNDVFADSTGADLTVNGYSATSTTPLFTGTAHLVLDQDTVEKLYELDISASYSTLSYITVGVSGFIQSSNTDVQSDVDFLVWTATEFNVDAASTSTMITLNSVSTAASPVQFSWSTACPGIPKYEFQLLRLFNEKYRYDDYVQKARGTVDWGNALSLIIENGATSIALHLTEGTGYYTWRVRPIGNYYEGEEANDKNWGAWSTGYAQDATFDITAATIPGNYAFFNTQFDASINFIYNRVFTEDNNIGENIIYGDGVGRVKQSQHHLQSDGHVLANQQLYDYSGRAALQSMTGPIERDYFDYEEKYLTSTASKLYRAKDFDSTTTYNNPSPVLGGKLSEYYSNSNTDTRIPDADGYPYGRTLYYADGTNRPKEIAVPGNTFRIGSTSSGDNRTVKVYYSSVEDDELVRVFGDEAAVDTSVYKIMQIDPNKVITVTYKTVDGKTIITCLANSGVDGDNELLDDLENDPFDVEGSIDGNTPTGTNTYKKEKTFFIPQPTTLWASYTITPSEIAATCGDYCSSCDYNVYGYIKENGNVVWDTTITIPASACSSGGSFTFYHELTTNVSEYTVGRSISVNNDDTSSANSYLENHQDTMAAIMDIHLDENFTTMYAYLEEADVEGFYDYLVSEGYATESQIEAETDITVTTECCTLTVPVSVCPPEPCASGTPGFEELLYGMWENKYGNAFQSYSRQSDVFDYPDNATFNSGSIVFTSAHNGTYSTDGCNTYINLQIVYTAADGSIGSYVFGDEKICLDDYMITNTSTAEQILSAVSTATSDYIVANYPDNNFAPYYIYGDRSTLTLTVIPNLDAPQYRGVVSGSLFAYSPSFSMNLTDWAFDYTATGDYPYGIGALDNLVDNMILDGYDCDTLYYNWFALCSAFESLQFDSDGNEQDFNIVESFLASVGTMYGSASTTQYGSTGYLTNAHKIINYTTGTCTECESADAYDYANSASWDDDTRTEPDSMKTWYQFYQCTKTCGSSLSSGLEDLGYDITDCDGTDDVACAEALVDIVADSCYSLCDSRANSFEAAIRAEYAYEGLTIEDSVVICLREALVAECQGNCGLTVYTHMEDTTDDGVSNIVEVLDSVGNEYEMQALTEALTYSFDLRIPTDSTCEDMGYKTISYSVNTSEIIGDAVVEGLNENLEEFLNKSINHDTTIYGAHISYGTNEIYTEYGFSASPYNCNYTLMVSLLSSYAVDSTSYFYQSGTTIYLHYYYEVMLAAGGVVRSELDVAVLSLKNCDIVWTCGPLCFKWEVPEVPRDPDTVEISTCEENAALYLMGILDGQMQDCKDQYILDITESYQDSCVDPANIDDVLTHGYQLGFFHYTLFYYDRGGNLVETVPPMGVDETNDTRTDSPNNPTNAEAHYHTYKTTYEYNSRKQMLAKTTPDGGKTNYFYNDLGQLRFSQNAQQKSDSKYSYLKYDALGRVTESGQASICSTCDFTHINQLTTNANTTNAPSSGGEEETYTVYTDAATGINYTDIDGNIYSQKYLTNRISYVHTDDDGDATTTDDQSHTYYSYDPHGNVEWLIQAMSGLSNKQIGFEYDLISGKVTKVKCQEGQADQYYYQYSYDADNRLTAVKTSRDNKIWDTDATYKYFAYGPLERTVLGEDKVQGLDYVYTLQGWLKAINHPEVTQGYDYGQDGVAGTTNEKIPADAFGMVLNYYEGDFSRPGSVFNNKVGTNLLTKLNTSHNGFSTSSNDYKSYYNGFISNIASNNAATVTNKSGQPMAGMFLYDELGRLTQNTVDFYSGSWNGSTGNTSDYYEHFEYDVNGNITGVTRNKY